MLDGRVAVLSCCISLGPCRSQDLIDGQRAFLQRSGLLRLAQVPQDLGQVVQVAGDIGVVRAPCGLGDGQRAFLQRPGPLQIPQVPQDQGQVVQADGDVGVVRAISGLIDGQCAFLQRPGPLRLPQVPQDQGQVASGPGRRRGGRDRGRPRRWPGHALAAAGPPPAAPGPAGSAARLFRQVATSGWSGPWAASVMARARSCSGRARSGCPRSRKIRARLFRSVATSGWSGPWAASAMARARSCSGRACSGCPRSRKMTSQAVETGGDVGVVGAVGGLGDGQGAFSPVPSRRRAAHAPAGRPRPGPAATRHPP